MSSSKMLSETWMLSARKNWNRNFNNHASPLSLTWHTLCQISKKYKSHCNKKVTECSLLRFVSGVGSGGGEEIS